MRFRPALLVVVAFAAVILIGAVVLPLQSLADGRAEVEIIRSAFTSASAVCVTGPTVVALWRDMGFGGQVVRVPFVISKGACGVRAELMDPGSGRWHPWGPDWFHAIGCAIIAT